MHTSRGLSPRSIILLHALTLKGDGWWIEVLRQSPAKDSGTFRDFRFRRIITGGVGVGLRVLLRSSLHTRMHVLEPLYHPIHAVATSLIVNIHLEPMVDNADCAYIDRAMSP